MADPFETIRERYERLNVELTERTERARRAFLAYNTRDKHGTHHDTFVATGLDAGETRERARRYQTYFDVPTDPLP